MSWQRWVSGRAGVSALNALKQTASALPVFSQGIIGSFLGFSAVVSMCMSGTLFMSFASGLRTATCRHAHARLTPQPRAAAAFQAFWFSLRETWRSQPALEGTTSEDIRIKASSPVAGLDQDLPSSRPGDDQAEDEQRDTIEVNMSSACRGFMRPRLQILPHVKLCCCQAEANLTAKI